MTSTVVGAAPIEVGEPSGPMMSRRQIMFVIYGLMAGMFLSSLDQTIVGTAIRTIGDDLNGLDHQAWVSTAYLITGTISTPLYGKLSDIFGRRPLFLTSITIFIAGSLLSSFSTSMIMLAAFRAFQGLGAGGLMSLPMAITGDMLAPRERAKYQGYFMSVFGVSAVLGPLVGGFFAGADEIAFIAGWRWVFLVNVPIGLVAFVLVFRFLHLPHINAHKSVRVDWWGAGLLVATLAPLLLVAEQGRDWGWTSQSSMLCYGIGAASLVVFILLERWMGNDAILPLRLFKSKHFSTTSALSLLFGFGMFGAMMSVPLYLQIVLGLTPTEAGLTSAPMMLGVALSSVGAGQIVRRTGRYRIFLITGTAIVAIGFLMLTRLTLDAPLPYLLAAMLVTGLGLGQLMQSITLAGQASAPAADIGVASSTTVFFRQTGGTLAIAVLLSMLFGTLPANVSNALSDKATLTAALDAALDPAVASAPRNQGIMDKMWSQVTDKIHTQISDNLDTATKAVNDQVAAAVRKNVSDAVHRAGSIGAAKLATGAAALSAGLDKLQNGTNAYVAGVGTISDGTSTLATDTANLASGASQLATGMASASSAQNAAAGRAKDATADFAALQAALTQLGTDSGSCHKGDQSACGDLNADQAAVTKAMTALGTSVYVTSGYLNGVDGKPGLATGLSELAAGAQRLATGTSKLSAGASELAAGTARASSEGGKLTTAVVSMAAGSSKLSGGAGKIAGLEKLIDTKVAQLTPGAQAKALKAVAKKQHLSVVNGKLAVDYSDPTQRKAIIDTIAPKLITQIKAGDSAKIKTNTDTSDTSFLTGADPRLSKPFQSGFRDSMVSVWWMGITITLLAFVLALSFKAPPLRSRSALEEKAEAAR